MTVMDNEERNRIAAEADRLGLPETAKAWRDSRDPAHKVGCQSLDDWHHEDVPDHLCPMTGTYCTGQFCGDYGCAKEAGFWDEDDD